MKNKKTSFKSIAWLLSIAMLLLWLVTMIALSVHQTVVYEDILYNAGLSYAREFARFGELKGLVDLRDVKKESVREEWMESVAMFSGDQSDNTVVLYGWMSNKKIPANAAVIVYDGEGQEYFSSRSSCMWFSYITERNWESGDRIPDDSLWLEVGNDPEVMTALETMRENGFFYANGGFANNMRITGYVRGDKIVPAKISYVLSNSVEPEESAWITVLDRTVPPNSGGKVTLYTAGGKVFWPTQEQEVIWQGKTYDGLTDQLRKENTEIRKWMVRNPFEMYMFSQHTVYSGEGEQKEVAYTVHTVVKCSPILVAMEKLVVIYQLTFLLTALAVWLILRRIRRNLTLPIRTLNAQMAGEFPPELEYDSEWIEPVELEQRFTELTDTIKIQNDELRRKENEINRLNQALDYAKQAEENRRSVISAVAHELKTPLAVIHGYTEGLQENIAEEKKDQYLATILSESERMDKLVMEMLDLSRLEAGKVKLARDTFFLTELIQSVFDRLSREMEKKSLQVTFDLHCEGQIHADEGRMEQVILNLASNAVRYTPAGGHIRVRTEKKVGMVFFYMENDATPFAQEELTKVWETFYRTDRARNGKGTGLGLAIVKNIIKLHGGTCYARNTQSGVEFSFHIPQI
jgi:signal transduction histidine kinase